MNKIVVITGGSDGLGKTLATSLSNDNNVIILATNEEKLKEVVKNMNGIFEYCQYNIVDK